MSYLALYRQFRPKNFDEVIAQNHIVETLRHQVQNGTISHAYLFCGTRGTGKTSCAKIFAKAVNCLHPKNGSPCGECDVCKAIDAGGNFDIMEIDAASNNRVDEIRDLREKINYLPSVGKYKVYIIDEVHMLTDSAFNALLKTLEEPPSHVIFVLATTEPEKLPATILSRCMRFDFKLVGIDALTKQLKKVFDQTQTSYDEKALELIAKAGNGSVRDTLSVAEMCKAFCGGNITYNAVQECLGLTDNKTLFDIAMAVAKKDGGTILQRVDELYNLGKNMNTLLGDICDFFNNVLTIKLAIGYNLNVPQNVLDYYKEVANLCDVKYLVDILKSLAESMAQIKFCYNEKVFAETALLGLFYNNNFEFENIKQRLTVIESGQVIINQNVQDDKKKLNLVQDETKSNIVNDNLPNSFFENTNLSQQTDIAKTIFGELIGYIRQSGEMMLFAGLQDVIKVAIQDNSFEFECKTQDIVNMILEHKNLITKFLKDNHNISSIQTKIYVDENLQKIEKLKELLDGKLEIKD